MLFLTLVEKLFKMSPQYDIRVFRCSCFLNIREVNKHKLQFRSIECTFIGYSTNHKGHKCLDTNGKVIISRNFLFNENSFPFSKQDTQTTPLSSCVSTPQDANSVPTASIPTNSSPIVPIVSFIDHEQPNVECNEPSDTRQTNFISTCQHTHRANQIEVWYIQTQSILCCKGTNLNMRGPTT